MFSTLPHLPQGYPGPYDRCSSPACFTEVNPQSWLGATLWEESIAPFGLNKNHPEASNPSLARWRVAMTKMLLGLLNMSPGVGCATDGGGQAQRVFFFTRRCSSV